MRQVLIIHGGSSFDSYERYIDDLRNSTIDYERLKRSIRWSEWLTEKLPNVDILTPRFPNAQNAIYEEWKIYFEKLIPFLDNDVQLVGHSLGAMFLAIYLNEKKLPQKVKKVMLISGGYDDATNEDLGSFKVTSAKNIVNNAEQIHLFHSKDDPVVPFTELAKFQKDLPTAVSHVFQTRGHFLQPTFPELLELLKQK